MHQKDHFIVMLSQTLLHVSAYQRHHQGAHMILTSYLYVGVLEAVDCCSTTVHCFQQQLTKSTYINSVRILIEATSLDIPLFFL
jgi:hypothetical protein